MRRPGLRGVVAFSALGVLGAAAWLAMSARPDPADAGWRLREAMEREAALRFERQGLAPCPDWALDTDRALRHHLVRIGEHRAALAVLVAPAFDPMSLLVFERGAIRAYRYPDGMAFDGDVPPPPPPPAASSEPPRLEPAGERWPSVVPRPLAEWRLEGRDDDAVLAPLLRHARYASGRLPLVADGVSYLFATGDGACAMAISHRGDTPAARVMALLDTAATGEADAARLRELAAAIDTLDARSLEPPEGGPPR
jgi:hypothetical protein